MNNSIWAAKTELPAFPELNKDIKTDVLIIGGGMTGILCAYMLENAGTDYVLVEADRICGGVTGNTTAKITSQHGLIYDKLIKQLGIEKARMYLNANEDALKMYRTLCSEIDCGFEEKSSFVYSIGDRRKIEKEVKALYKLGFDAEFVEETTLPFAVDGAVKFKNQAQFNPLMFVKTIAQGLNIYENTRVMEIAENTVRTTGGKITARKIIAATHFPLINKHGSYFLKMYQHRSYVIAYENAPDVEGMYVDEAKEGMSFRNYDNFLLIGGGGHRTGKQGGNWNEIETFARIMYPSAAEKYRWAAQDCMSLDGVPYVGRYSKHTSDFYVATGFNKWGMTTSMASAKILTDMILGKNNEYEAIFTPSRTILRPQLAVNAFEAAISILTPTSPRCPHMGCALKYNGTEHTWDCPCHGSRFSDKGKLIDNPATGNMYKHTKK